MSYTDTREDMMRSFNTIAKTGGSFKSPKQAAFLMKTCDDYGLSHAKPDCFVADLVLAEGQSFIVIDGEVRWADYGRRSIRKYGFAFVVDKFGVVAKYKLKYKHDSNGCTYPDKTAASLEFTRSAINDSLVQAFAEQEEKKAVEQVSKKHVGNVGDKPTMMLTLKKQSHSVGYYGLTTCYFFSDAEGNDLTWFSSKDVGLEEGQTYNMAFTIKAHQEYEGIPSTIITRAKQK